jgi:protein-L-isoaspartate(D-aspartate) O-methyltransferase
MIEQDPAFLKRASRLVNILREKGLDDERLLRAIGRVQRHRFVSRALRHRAYWDEALPIGLGQTISQPYTVAYQTWTAGVREGDRVLEIGTGSGYQAAVLVALGADVYTIERLSPLLEHALTVLRELDCRVTARVGDGTRGWPEYAPFDVILVTAGARRIPEALLEQLRVPDEDHAGGRLVIPVGGSEGQTMVRVDRTGPTGFEHKRSLQFRFVPLVEGE